MQYSVYAPVHHAIYKNYPGCLNMAFFVAMLDTVKITSVSLYQINNDVCYLRIMEDYESEEGA